MGTEIHLNTNLYIKKCFVKKNTGFLSLFYQNKNYSIK